MFILNNVEAILDPSLTSTFVCYKPCEAKITQTAVIVAMAVGQSSLVTTIG